MPGNLAAVLTSWPLLFSLAALVANDYFFKYAFPGLVTGKLSDFAGIFLVASLAFALLPRRRVASAVAILILFTWWKSPLSQPFVDTINALAPLRFGRVVDYWDLLAFSMIPLAHRYVRCAAAQSIASRRRTMASAPIAAVALLAMTGTSVVMPTEVFRIRSADPELAMDPDAIAAAVERVAGNYGGECEQSVEGDKRTMECTGPDLWLFYLLHEPSGTAQFMVQGSHEGGSLWSQPDPDLLERVLQNLEVELGRVAPAIEYVAPPEDNPYVQFHEFMQMLCDEDPDCEKE